MGFTGLATIEWDANTEVDLAGYRIYYGRASGVYDGNVNVGNATTGSVTLTDSGAWFFAVTAYDTSNNESAFSTEVSRSWLLLGNFPSS